MTDAFVSSALSTVIGLMTGLLCLHLSGKNLNASLPFKLGLLNDRIEISLAKTGIAGSLPEDLHNGLKHLEILDILDAEFSGMISSKIENWGNLGTLDVSNNYVEGTLPELQFPCEVIRLAVCGNNLTAMSLPDSLCGAHSCLSEIFAVCLSPNGEEAQGSLCPETGCCTDCCDRTDPRGCHFSFC